MNERNPKIANSTINSSSSASLSKFDGIQDRQRSAENGNNNNNGNASTTTSHVD